MCTCVYYKVYPCLHEIRTGSRVVCEETLKALENEEVDESDGELLTVETHIDDEAFIVNETLQDDETFIVNETLQDDKTFIDDESVSPYKRRKLLVDAIMDEDLDKENLPPNNDSVCKKRKQKLLNFKGAMRCLQSRLSAT